MFTKYWVKAVSPSIGQLITNFNIDFNNIEVDNVIGLWYFLRPFHINFFCDDNVNNTSTDTKYWAKTKNLNK